MPLGGRSLYPIQLRNFRASADDKCVGWSLQRLASVSERERAKLSDMKEDRLRAAQGRTLVEARQQYLRLHISVL
jgi:hypothetical protein